MHFKYLDSLRGIAILGILVVHSAIITDQTGRILKLAMSGQRGVQLFYIVSAFTLFMSLDSRTRRETHTVANFFIRRFFRIAPLYYFAIVMNLLYQGLAPREEAPDGLNWLDILSGFTFLNGFQSHTINSVAIGGWSIAVETSFYAIVPILYAHVRNLKQAMILWLISSFSLIPISYALAHKYPNPKWDEYFKFFWFPVEMPVFCMGIVAYFIWKLDVFSANRSTSVDANVDQSDKETGHWSAILIVLALAIFISSLPNDNKTLHWSSLAFVSFVLGLSLKGWKLFVNPITTFLGRISYSMYLMHFFVLIGVKRCFVLIQSHTSLKLMGTPLGFASFFLTALLVSAAVSYLTYLFIEQPGMNLGKYLVKRNEQIPASAS